ncbi:transposable element Tc1 transposase [Trichonephila clavipes]|nr:transposable element Tc1 transposase [Trichonephila clavipes]
MLTVDVECLTTNPASDFVLTIIEDMSGEAQDSRHPGLIFRQDNAGPHTVHVAMDCLTACQAFPWPARSPDVSPIEHVYDMTGRRLHLKGNVHDLARQLEKMCQEIPRRRPPGYFINLLHGV